MKLLDRLSKLSLASLLLGSCISQPPAPGHDPYLEFPAGSSLEVHQAITIPAEHASIMIQHGNILYGSFDQYTANCRLILKTITPVPHTVRPATFQIKKVNRDDDAGVPVFVGIAGSRPVEYETEFLLESSQQPEVYSLNCRHWDDALNGAHLTLKQIRDTLAGLISIRLP